MSTKLLTNHTSALSSPMYRTKVFRSLSRFQIKARNVLRLFRIKILIQGKAVFIGHLQANRQPKTRNYSLSPFSKQKRKKFSKGLNF